jgi:hypothetical protein
MALFMVALQFKQDRSVLERRSSAVKALTSCAEPLFSAEPVLLALAEYDKSSIDLTQAIAKNSKFASATDLVLAVNLSHRGHAYFGNATESQIRRAMERR